VRRLIARPATVVLTDVDNETTIVCMAAYLNKVEGNMLLELEGTESIRYIDVDTIVAEGPGRVEGTTSPNGLGLVARATIDDDAVAVKGMPGYPLPVPVITATIAGENMDTHIEALVEDDGYVSTLLLVTDIGLFTRYARTWIGLRDVGLIDGLNSIEVYDGAVDVYDTADDLGQQVSVEALPSEQRNAVGAGQLFVSANAQMSYNPDADEAVTASAMALLPVIDTLEQLTAAVESADTDETLRWYVEKRALALGADVEMPWKS
jgi:hypothetical protein